MKSDAAVVRPDGDRSWETDEFGRGGAILGCQGVCRGFTWKESSEVKHGTSDELATSMPWSEIGRQQW